MNAYIKKAFNNIEVRNQRPFLNQGLTKEPAGFIGSFPRQFAKRKGNQSNVALKLFPCRLKDQSSVVDRFLKKILKNILGRRFDLPTKLKFDNVSASPDL